MLKINEMLKFYNFTYYHLKVWNPYNKMTFYRTQACILVNFRMLLLYLVFIVWPWYAIQVVKCFILGGDLWSTAADDSQSSEQNSFMSSIENGRSDQQRADQRKSTSDNGDSNRFLCGKCNTKLTNTEAFRDHVEQCFS